MGLRKIQAATVLSLLLSQPAFAQVSGSSCNVTNELYFPRYGSYPDSNAYICNGSTLTTLLSATASPLQLDLLAAVGIGSTSPVASLDISQKTDALALPSGTTGQRPTGTNGMLRYNSTVPQVEAYVNGSWTALNGGGGGSSNLGTSVTAASPQVSGDATTGLYTSAAGHVDVAASGTQIIDWSSAGQNIAKGNLSIAGNNALYQDYSNANVFVGPTPGTGTISQAGGGYNGGDDTALGYYALSSVTTGYQNTAIGMSALQNLTTGIENTAIGYLTLAGNGTFTGNGNVGVGWDVAPSVTTASNNVFIGYGAGTYCSSCTKNVVIGYNSAPVNLATGSYNVLIGPGVDTPASGTNSYLNLGNILVGDMTYSASANKTLYLQSTSGGVDYLQIAAGATGSPGVVTISAQGSDTNVSISLTSKGTGVTQTSGKLKVGSFASSSATTVCSNSGTLSTCSSSRRYKENISDATLGLAEIKKMRPVVFDWKDRQRGDPERHDFGLIAEEVEDINPLFVTYKDGRVEGVKYPQLTAVLVNAIKEQQREMEEQRQEISVLKQDLTALKSSLAGH